MLTMFVKKKKKKKKNEQEVWTTFFHLEFESNF